MITRYFNLQLNAGGALPPVINVNQYDSGESWVFTLYQEDGTVYQPSSGSIVGLKADGNAIANAGSIDADGRVVITETQQMTAVAGKVDCELTLDAGTHGTLNFTIEVEPDPVDGTVVSESDISLLEQGIQAAEDARVTLLGLVPDNVGETGQVLTKTASGARWVDAPQTPSDSVYFADTETLTTKMAAAQSDISDNASDITTNANNISSLQTTVSSQGDSITSLTQLANSNTRSILSLESAVAALVKIRFVAFSGTVNRYGNLSLSSPTNKPIVGVDANNTSTYVMVGKNGSGANMLCFRSTTTNAGLAEGTAVTGYVYYIDD